MQPVRKRFLILWAVVCLVCSYLVSSTMIKRGYSPFIFHPILAAITLLGAVVLLYFGRQVVHLKRREQTWMAASQAPYVALVAQAAAIWSAILIGFLLGELIVVWTIRTVSGAPDFFLRISVLLVATVVLEVCSLLVEHWCKVDEPDPDADTDQSSGKRGLSGRSSAYGRFGSV